MHIRIKSLCSLLEALLVASVTASSLFKYDATSSAHLSFLFGEPLKLNRVGWSASVPSYSLTGPLIHRVVSKPFLCYLGCVLRVIVRLGENPLFQSEVRSALEQVIIEDVSVHVCIHLSLDPDRSPRSAGTVRLPPPPFTE